MTEDEIPELKAKVETLEAKVEALADAIARLADLPPRVAVIEGGKLDAFNAIERINYVEVTLKEQIDKVSWRVDQIEPPAG